MRHQLEPDAGPGTARRARRDRRVSLVEVLVADEV